MTIIPTHMMTITTKLYRATKNNKARIKVTDSNGHMMYVTCYHCDGISTRAHDDAARAFAETYIDPHFAVESWHRDNTQGAYGFMYVANNYKLKLHV